MYNALLSPIKALRAFIIQSAANNILWGTLRGIKKSRQILWILAETWLQL